MNQSISIEMPDLSSTSFAAKIVNAADEQHIIHFLHHRRWSSDNAFVSIGTLAQSFSRVGAMPTVGAAE
jgi:two-component SAPR family response regulator